MRRWKSRTLAFTLCFSVGLLAAFVCASIFGLFARRQRPLSLNQQSSDDPCAAADYFQAPEQVLSALKSSEVNVRREMFQRLFVRPSVATVYYDYERDLNYPERADRARLAYVQLDTSAEPEALLTFVRFEHPVALVFKKQSCGWQLIAALSSWLRFENYPYETWLSLPETIKPGVHELLVRDSTGDAASYLSKARLLKLNGDSLNQIAEIDEVSVEPLRDYQGSDWSDVRRRQATRFTFKQGSVPRIQVETTDEVIKFSGSAPNYSYWLETDGSWHALQRNWTARVATRQRLLGVTQEQLVWNEQEKRFVK